MTRARRSGSPVSPAMTRPCTTAVPTTAAGPRAEISRVGVPGIPGPVDVATDGAGDGAFWPCTSGGEQTTATVARTARASDEIREMDMGGVFERYGSGGSLSATVSV